MSGVSSVALEVEKIENKFALLQEHESVLDDFERSTAEAQKELEELEKGLESIDEMAAEMKTNLAKVLKSLRGAELSLNSSDEQKNGRPFVEITEQGVEVDHQIEQRILENEKKLEECIAQMERLFEEQSGRFAEIDAEFPRKRNKNQR